MGTLIKLNQINGYKPKNYLFECDKILTKKEQQWFHTLFGIYSINSKEIIDIPTIIEKIKSEMGIDIFIPTEYIKINYIKLNSKRIVVDSDNYHE